MKFKGTIIITDPCYVIKEDIVGERVYNDWEKCKYGENMEALGISHYICRSTIYGDWSCTTYKITEDPYKVIDNFVEASEKGEDYGVNCSKLGNFCADAGLVAVFNLDEVRKYNPDIDEWIASHDWCVTVIPDFKGRVDYYVDRQGAAHIVGIGNINFFTDQTGL